MTGGAVETPIQEIPGVQRKGEGSRCLGADEEEEKEEQGEEAGARWPGPERPLLPRVRKGGTPTSFPREDAPESQNSSLLLCQEGGCELHEVKHPSLIPSWRGNIASLSSCALPLC